MTDHGGCGGGTVTPAEAVEMARDVVRRLRRDTQEIRGTMAPDWAIEQALKYPPGSIASLFSDGDPHVILLAIGMADVMITDGQVN